jgi:hypothetical protein
MTRTLYTQKIQEYLAVSDDKVIKAVYTLLEAQVKATESNFEFSEEQIKELNKRRKEHLSGKSKTYTFEQIKSKILAKHKK